MHTHLLCIAHFVKSSVCEVNRTQELSAFPGAKELKLELRLQG